MVMRLLKSFLSDRHGGTAVEYGLLMGLIALGLLAGLGALSNSLKNTFMSLSNNMKTP